MDEKSAKATDEQIREMDSKLAAQAGFGEEAAFDGREAAHDEGAPADAAARTDEQIREMNAEFAAHEGFAAEEEFDEREAAHDAAE